MEITYGVYRLTMTRTGTAVSRRVYKKTCNWNMERQRGIQTSYSFFNINIMMIPTHSITIFIFEHRSNIYYKKAKRLELAVKPQILQSRWTAVSRLEQKTTRSESGGGAFQRVLESITGHNRKSSTELQATHMINFGLGRSNAKNSTVQR